MKLFPRTETLKTDVLKLKGYLPSGCILKEGVVLPMQSAQRYGGYSCPEGMKYIVHTQFGEGFILFTDTTAYVSPNGYNFTKFIEIDADSPFLVECRDIWDTPWAVVVGDEKIVVLRHPQFSSTLLTTGLSCGVIRCGRLFGADKEDGFKLKWSGEEGIKDWQQGISGAGWTYLTPKRGKILNLFDFEDELVIIREYGITRMQTAGTPENYAVKRDDLYLSRVIKESCVQMSDRLAFCTEDGLFAYKGGKAERWEDGLADDIINPVRAICPDGRRYLLCATSKRLGRKVVYVFSAGGCGYIVDIPAEFLAGHENVRAYEGDRVYGLVSGGKYSFVSGQVNFDTSRDKVLKRIEVESEGEVDVTVTNGVATRRMEGVRGRARLNMRGREFTITVEGDGAVRGVTAFAEAVK